MMKKYINISNHAWIAVMLAFCLQSAEAQYIAFKPHLGSLDPEQSAIVENLNALPTTLRMRIAVIDIKSFSHNEISFQLFSDFNIVLRSQDIGHRGITMNSWTGNFPTRMGSGAFVINGSRVSGHIVSLDGNFEIFPLGNKGVHAIVQHNPLFFRDCGNSTEHNERQQQKMLPNKIEDHEIFRNEPDDIPVDPTNGGSTEVNGEECFIRVIVGYTQLAQSGTSSNFGRTMVEHVSLAVLESNQGYANSDVDQRMELAYLYETTDNETVNACNDVNDLQSGSDGKWDEIHAHRDTYRGDMVCLITGGLYNTNADCNPNGGLCGLAFGFDYTSAGNMFQVTEFSCATGNYTFAHEFGHNQGCRHDNDNTGTPFSYARGYNEGTNFRTIMAVCCNPVRINFWSNPDINYLNFGATGTVDRDNARALDVGDDVVSHHRTTPANITSSANILNDFSANFFATNSVVASITAQNGSDVVLKSYGRIEFVPGFHAKSGSKLITILDEACNGVGYAKTGNADLASEEPVIPELIIYPNPFDDQFLLKLDLPEATETEMTLLDVTGRTLFRQTLSEEFHSGYYEVIIPAESIPSGIYYMVVQNTGNRLVQKLVKTKM